MSTNPPTTPTVRLAISERTARVLAWVAWALILAGTVSGAIAAMSLVPAVGQQVAAGVAVITLLIAAEIRRQLPSARQMKREGGGDAGPDNPANIQ